MVRVFGVAHCKVAATMLMVISLKAVPSSDLKPT